MPGLYKRDQDITDKELINKTKKVHKYAKNNPV